MDRKQLIDQVKLVISILESEYSVELESGILNLIYKRYNKAKEIFENDKDIQELNISGGVRAYMDSYNDYQNPLLEQMNKTEKMIKEIG